MAFSAFQSTLPARGATWETAWSWKTTQYFNPRSPHGERPGGRAVSRRVQHFNPRSPHGERQEYKAFVDKFKPFQSTLPARGATFAIFCKLFAQRISIHAPRTGSDLRGWKRKFLQRISIHAPRTGSDGADALAAWLGGYFNPRSPHGERQQKTADGKTVKKFQSTLPARGATDIDNKLQVAFTFQSTLPARGATDAGVYIEIDASISIHAPRTGSDARRASCMKPESKFQSTLPARGATRLFCITTHIPCYFNPRSPHGERHTPSIVVDYYGRISIHAPRTGSDKVPLIVVYCPPTFQSTLPARGATTS